MFVMSLTLTGFYFVFYICFRPKSRKPELEVISECSLLEIDTWEDRDCHVLDYGKISSRQCFQPVSKL